MGNTRPPFLNWEWSDWHCLQTATRDDISPTEQGLYRISHSRTSGLEYVGYGDVNERIYRLKLGLSKDEMPFRDPHMAAPCLWALQQEHQGTFWVSWTAMGNSEEDLRGKKSAYIAQYRLITGQSPTANFGRMIDGYSSSSYQRWGRRGEKIDEPVSGQLTGLDPQSWENWKEVVSTDWMRYSWTDFQPLIPDWSNVSNIKDDIPSTGGLFRLRERNSSILEQIGKTPNLRESLFQLREGNTGEELEVSYTVTNFDHPRHWREAENDLLGVHYLATEVTPDSEDLNERIQPEDIQTLIDGGENQTTEFKGKIPPNGKKLTKDLLAFANTDGGSVLLGVRNDGEIIGIDDVQSTREQAVDLARSEIIQPQLQFSLEYVEIDGQNVVVIDVPAAEEVPISRNGIFFTRKGPQSIPMSGGDMQEFYEN